VWSWQSRRFFLYIGLPDTKPNRKAANIKAETIELDMTSGNFDQSLAKYKPQAESEAISVVEMFDRFTQQKQRTISICGLAKYLSLRSKSFSMSIAIPVVRFQSLGMSLNFNPQHFCFWGILPSNCSKMGLYLTGNSKAREPLSRYTLMPHCGAVFLT
jgi:hypothetical protein